MPVNENLWIEVKQAPQEIRYQYEVPGIIQNDPWQAMFACQIRIRPFEEREKLKWGFTAAFLLEEAIERQKLFVESQLNANPINEHSEQRTLALRCISDANATLRLGLVAKTLGATQEEAHEEAAKYCRELQAVFPYDYTLQAAKNAEEFERITGRGLVKECTTRGSIAQLQRFESPLQTSGGLIRVLGRWQTSLRSDEQIWRALANHPREIVLNVSIRPTVLQEGERRSLLSMRDSARLAANNQSIDEPYLQNYEAWLDQFISRHISPWNRYFYLQICLAAPGGIDDYVFRSIGSAITRESPDQSSPGFQVACPLDSHHAQEWSRYLDCLEVIHTGNHLVLPRLSELANLEEAQAVFRLPYPPQVGFPNAHFLPV